MSEKGGKNANSDGKFIETHHMLLIFMIVLNVIVIALCLVLLGMQLVKRQEDIAGVTGNGSEYIEEIKPISYELMGIYNYQCKRQRLRRCKLPERQSRWRCRVSSSPESKPS